METELLADGHRWLRVADSQWPEPLDPTHSMRSGGRWNPPDSFPALYLNEDVVTARLNTRLFMSGWPYEPEDLRDDAGPILVTATLPRNQRVADVHTPRGVRAAGLPSTYPQDASGRILGHAECQPIGARAKRAGLRGLRCRSAPTPAGTGRELAWFPATSRSRASELSRQAFVDWFW